MAAIQEGTCIVIFVLRACKSLPKVLNFEFFGLKFVLYEFWFVIWVSLPKTVWILFTADMPEQREEAPAENKAASSQVIYVCRIIFS